MHGRLRERDLCNVMRPPDSRLLTSLRRPLGRFNTELLCVLGVQLLPAVELHRSGADDAPNGLTGEKAIQHIEADVPAGGAPTR